MFSMRIQKIIIPVLMIFSMFDIQAQTGPDKQSPKNLSEGIIYSRTSFPGHKLNDSLKSLAFENGDFRK